MVGLRLYLEGSANSQEDFEIFEQLCLDFPIFPILEKDEKLGFFLI